MIRTVVVLALCVSVVSPLVAASRFVDDDAPPGGSGLDWDSPFDNLQSALALRNVDEIYVAGGTYVPTELAIQADDRSARYEIRDGVHIRGGYAGYDAKDPDLNDPVSYPTILSGDLAGDDQDDFKNRDDNAYHVLAAEDLEEGTVLEGLIIQGGHADGKGDARKGGGITLDSCVIEIIDCKFLGNWAELFGAGIFADFGDVTITGCT